jgi:hypothetical protein
MAAGSPRRALRFYRDDVVPSRLPGEYPFGAPITAGLLPRARGGSAGRLLAAGAAWWKKLGKHRRALLASLCGVLGLLAFRGWGSHRIAQVEVGIVLSLG